MVCCIKLVFAYTQGLMHSHGVISACCFYHNHTKQFYEMNTTTNTVIFVNYTIMML